jgi:hypothetical protein
MQINTTFSPGDKAWVTQYRHFTQDEIPREITVSLVRAEVVDSPGREGEELFDNYMPKKKYTEEYMAVETGIGSGLLYTLGENIFATREECEAAIERRATGTEGSDG